MAPPPLTPSQQAVYDDDRRPSLYAGLSVLLAINNVIVVTRMIAHWRVHYRHKGFAFRRVLVDDIFAVLSGISIDVIIANLLASTHYGLGLHSWRINAEDPNYPQNLSNAFKHVWITMVLTGPTFTFIKLTLLFFYRRLFLFNQRWLKIAWWGNVVYVILWFFGSTGFYLFQCWPVQWYFMQYYARYKVPPPYDIQGQCNATSTTHVAIPLIFGLASDVAILLLPIFTISQLKLSPKIRMGLYAVFSIGAIACILDMARIIELWVDTDDKIDPSYGVVIFLALSAATEVTAITCACLPVIGPSFFKEYKSRQRSEQPYKLSDRYAAGSDAYPRKSRGFKALEDSSFNTVDANGRRTTVERDQDLDSTPIVYPHASSGESNDSIHHDLGNQIHVERQIEVDFGDWGNK